MPASARLRTPLLVAVLALLAVFGAAPARAAELGLVTDLTWGAAPADKDREYAILDELGARWIRLNANWAEIERSPGAYNAWSLGQLDEAVRRNRAAGRQVVIMIGESPAWASGSSYEDTPPRDRADYARFAGFIAHRYAGAGIAGYEIWNEENTSRFWGRRTPDASAYVGLLRAASAAVRGADRGAKVVFGGLSTNDSAYVKAAYDAGAQGLFDVMALHPYTCDARPDVISRGSDGSVAPSSFLGYRQVRRLMVARGDRLPMWFTEMGWSTSSGPCGVSEAQQADRLATAASLMKQDAYVRAAMIYNLRNNYWNADRDTLEARYGLMTTGFRPKPAFAVFRALAHGRPRATRARLTLHTASRGRGRRARVAVAGRVRGTRGHARVAIELRHSGRRTARRVITARSGTFRVALRPRHQGRYRAVARLVRRPHVHTSRTFSL